MQLIFYHLSLVCNWNQEPGYSNLKIRFWYYTGSNILKSLLCSNPLHLIKELVLQDLLLQVSAALEKGIDPKSPHFLCTKLVQVQSDRSAGVRSCSQATSEKTVACLQWLPLFLGCLFNGRSVWWRKGEWERERWDEKSGLGSLEALPRRDAVGQAYLSSSTVRAAAPGAPGHWNIASSENSNKFRESSVTCPLYLYLSTP